MPKLAKEELIRFEAWRGRGGKSTGGVRRQEDDPDVPDGDEEETLDGKMIGLRLSQKDRERFARAAEAEGVSLTEYIRDVVRKAEVDEEVTFKLFVRHLEETKSLLKNYVDENEGMASGGFLGEKSSREYAIEGLGVLTKMCERLTRKPGEKKPADKSGW